MQAAMVLDGSWPASSPGHGWWPARGPAMVMLVSNADSCSHGCLKASKGNREIEREREPAMLMGSCWLAMQTTKVMDGTWQGRETATVGRCWRAMHTATAAMVMNYCWPAAEAAMVMSGHCQASDTGKETCKYSPAKFGCGAAIGCFVGNQ